MVSAKLFSEALIGKPVPGSPIRRNRLQQTSFNIPACETASNTKKIGGTNHKDTKKSPKNRKDRDERKEVVKRRENKIPLWWSTVTPSFLLLRRVRD